MVHRVVLEVVAGIVVLVAVRLLLDKEIWGVMGQVIHIMAQVAVEVLELQERMLVVR
jgi:hypothetical protein